ncbi:MAG TPA: DUF6279 family lipoprotein [Thioalkalivibrio sp.]|nr:DUF6279 family lipoprotein [Thioalkalivibrio sp.]
MMIWRVLLLLLAAASLSGCGVRMLYHQLDWLIPWQLQGYVTLDSSQRLELEVLVEDRLDWHCRTQLPRYAEWLRAVEHDLRNETVGPQWLAERADDAGVFWNELMRPLSHDVAAVLGDTSDAQIDELFRNLDARTRDQMNAFVNREDHVLIQERAERLEQRLRRWFGRMNADQRARIQAWSEDLGLFAHEWLENRGRWQAQLRHALDESERRPESLQPALERLMVHPEQTWSPDYVERLERQRKATWLLLADLYQTSSERQRNRLISRAGSLVRDFERLSCAPLEQDPDSRR